MKRVWGLGWLGWLQWFRWRRRVVDSTRPGHTIRIMGWRSPGAWFEWGGLADSAAAGEPVVWWVVAGRLSARVTWVQSTGHTPR